MISLGSVSAAGAMSATGNITAPNFIGNLIGNLAAPGSNSQVIFNLEGSFSTDSGLVYDYCSQRTHSWWCSGHS
jgi:hypothetical protein